jgi:acetamidase/formamidase
LICSAETHRVTASKFYNSFHHRHPVLQKIKPGDTVITRTIDAERRCCRFLRFQLTVEPADGPVLLDLTGPPGTREFVAALFSAG